MRKEDYLSRSVNETLRIAGELAGGLRPGLRIGLVGELGAGKTVFAKGVVSALTGLPPEEIPSPTFTLVEEYAGKFPIYHVDLYRIGNPAEAKELAWDDLFGPEGLTLIEWPERIPRLLQRCQIEVHLSKEGAEERNLEIVEKDVHE